jgi:hypothetical protein
MVVIAGAEPRFVLQRQNRGGDEQGREERDKRAPGAEALAGATGRSVRP